MGTKILTTLDGTRISIIKFHTSKITSNNKYRPLAHPYCHLISKTEFTQDEHINKSNKFHQKAKKDEDIT